MGTYERSFRIGEGVDAERMSAEVKNGVRTLTLPESEAGLGPKITVSG